MTTTKAGSLADRLDEALSPSLNDLPTITTLLEDLEGDKSFRGHAGVRSLSFKSQSLSFKERTAAESEAAQAYSPRHQAVIDVGSDEELGLEEEEQEDEFHTKEELLPAEWAVRAKSPLPTRTFASDSPTGMLQLPPIAAPLRRGSLISEGRRGSIISSASPPSMIGGRKHSIIGARRTSIIADPNRSMHELDSHDKKVRIAPLAAPIGAISS